MAGLHFGFTGDNSSFMRAIHEVTAGVQDASRQIELNGGNIDRVISQIKGGLATLGVGLGFKELAGQIFETRAQFEQLEIAFTTMLGSADKANSLLNQLKQTAAKTPFEMEDVVGGAKSLLAYGIEAEKVNDTLVRLGDIASGLGIQLNDLTYLYGTTMVQGRMFTQDLRQFQGRGVPIADELAKILGIAKDKVGEAVTAGKVGAKELEQAIIGLTSEGGKFGGLMAKQSDSLKGKWENIKDTIGLMFNEMGQQTSGVMNLTLDATASIVDHWQEVITVLGGVAAAYGAQKAYLMLDTAFTAAKTDFGYSAEIEQLQALIPAKKEAAKTDLEQAVASGRLTEAKAAQIASMREEAEEYVKTLALKAEEARQAEITAQANLTTALQEKKIADDWVQAAQEKWEAAYDTADAIAEEAASIELETAKTIQSEAVDAVAEATKEAKAASSAHVAAQQAAETASTQLNTAQTAGNTAATNILTIAKERLALVMAKVNAVMAANKYAIIIGAVIALGYAVYKLITYQSEEEKRAEAVSEAHAKCMSEYAREKKALTELSKTLETAKKGSDEWKAAKDAIVSQYGQYFKNLDAEIEKVGNLSTSYSILTREVKKSIVARQLQEYDENHKVDVASTLKNSLNRISSGFMVYNPNTGKNERKVASKALQLQWQDQLSSYMMNGGEGELDPLLVKALKNQKSTWYGGHHSVWDDVEEDIKNIKANNADKEKIANSVGLTLDEVFKQETYDNTKTKNLQTAYDEASKNYKAATKKVEAMKKNRKAYTEKEWEKAQEDLKSAKDAYEKAGGETKTKKSGSGATPAQIESKQDNAHQKLLDLMKQQAEERLKQEQDYEYQRWQTRIDLMDDGEQKVIAQMRLDQSKEMASLEEQKKNAINAEIARQKALFDAQQDEKAAGNKKYAKQVFNPEKNIDMASIEAIKSRYAELEKDLTSKHEHAERERIANDLSEMNQYLQNYGTFQQQKLAIAEEYNKKIEAAANKTQRLTLEKERDAKLAEVDVNRILGDIDWSVAFDGVGNVLRDMAKETLDAIEEYMNTEEFKKLKPADKKAYVDARKKLKDEGVGSANSPFNFKQWDNIAKLTKEYQKSVDNLRIASQQHTAAVNNLAQAKEIERKATEKLAKATTVAEKKIAKTELEIAKHGVNMAQTQVDNTAADVQDKKDKKNESGENLKDATTAATNGLNNFRDVLGEISNGTLYGFANGLTKLITSLMSGSDGVGKSLGELGGKIGGLIGAILQIIDALGDEPVNFFDDLLMKVSNVVYGVLSQLPELVLTILKDVGNIVMNVGTGLLKMFGVDFDFNGSNAKEVAKKTEELTKRNELLQNSIDKLKESIDKSYGGKAITDYQKARTAAMEEIENQKQILNAQQKYHDNHHSNAYYWFMEKDYVDAVNELLGGEYIKNSSQWIGYDLSGSWDWNDWSKLTPEQMDKIRTNRPDIWTAMLENGKYDKSEYFEKYADLAGTLEELNNQIRENLLGVTFEGMRDDFISTLMDMTKDTEDFADQYTEMIQKAFLQANIGDKYEERMKEWYESITNAMMNPDGSYRDLTDEEIDKYRKEWNQLSEDLIKERDRIAEITGYGVDQIREKLTDISFDSVRDNFKSLMTDMESNTEDFTNNFTDMLRNALIEGLMDSKYDTLLKEWYANFAEAMDDQKLTDEERERLRQQYQSIIDHGIADRNAVNDIVGGGSYSQQASKGEVWGMTQETGEELNGRFTALVELQATNNTLTGQGNSLAIGILSTLQSIAAAQNTVAGNGNNETLLSIRDMMFLSTGHLEDIAKYTKRLQTISDDIAKMKEKVDNI